MMEELLQELDVYRKHIIKGASIEEIERKQKELDVVFPDGMKAFYSRFANDEEIMNSYYRIYPLSEIRIEEGALVYGEDHQGVTQFGITLKHLNSPYQSASYYDFKARKWYSNGFMFPESFFFNIACWQLVNSMESIAKVYVSFDELQRMMGDKLSFFTDDPHYLRSSRFISVCGENVLGSYFMEDEELYLATRCGDEVLNNLEEELKIDLDWL